MAQNDKAGDLLLKDVEEDIVYRIPCKYRISGQEKAVDWIKQKRKATTSLQEHSLAVNKCLGKKCK